MNKIVLVILLLIFELGGAFFLNQQYPDGRLQVEFFDVGQGDSTFINTINNKRILVDTGPDNRIVEKLNSKFKNLSKDIDYLILTHSDSDHIGGLIEVINEFNIKNIIFNFKINPNAKYQKNLEELLKNEGSNIIKVNADSDFMVDGCNIDFVWPSVEEGNLYEQNPSVLSTNDSSISLKLTYNKFDLFLGGDISTPVEDKIQNLIGQVEVMKLDHHGSNNSNSQDFLEILHPKYAIAEVGLNNKYNHPNPLVLKRLDSLGVQIYRTDMDQDIICSIKSWEDYSCGSVGLLNLF